MGKLMETAGSDPTGWGRIGLAWLTQTPDKVPVGQVYFKDQGDGGMGRKQTLCWE